MEEDRGSELQRNDALKRHLPLFILWVLCVTSAVFTFTSVDGEFNTTWSNVLFNDPPSKISCFQL